MTGKDKLFAYEGKIYANCVLVLSLALLIYAGMGWVAEEKAWSQWRSRYGTVQSVTVNNIINETLISETITVTEQITIQEAVDPNIIYDVVGGLDWWVMIDSTDGKKKTGKGDPADNATTVVATLDPNGVWWTEPNDAPDVVLEGEGQWDSDDDAMEITDGTVDFLVAQKVRMFSATLYDPTTLNGADADLPILPVESEKFPGGITMLSVGMKTDNSSTYTVVFKEFTSPSDGSPSTIESIATSGAYEAEDDGTLTDAAVAAGSIVYVTLPATAGTNYLQVWGTYYVNDND